MCEIFCFNSNKPKEVNECLKCLGRIINMDEKDILNQITKTK